MKRWARWIEDAVRPTAREVAQFAEPLSREEILEVSEVTRASADEVARFMDPLSRELVLGVAEVTRPTSDEVHRLLVGRHEWLEHRRRRRVVGGTVSAGVLVAATALFAVATGVIGPSGQGGDPSTQATYGPVSVSIGEVYELAAGAQLDLGPSIEVSGAATLRVDQADELGTVIALLDGRATFSVDPGGLYRSLQVQANEVQVEVAGTVFDVAVEQGGVQVDVSRGKVVVRHDGRERYVQAGGSWTDHVLAVDLPQPVTVVERRVASTDHEVARVIANPPRPSVRASSPSRPEPQASPEPVQPHEVEQVIDVDAGPAPEVVAWRALDRTRAGGIPPEQLLAELDAYIAAYGSTSYGNPAKLLRLHVLAEHRPGRAVIDEIDAYLEGNPRERQRTELLWVRAEIARAKLHDCGIALSSYRALVDLVHETDERAGQAHAWLGLCAITEGQDQEAHAALQRAIVLGVDSESLLDQVVNELEALNAQGRRRR